MAPTKSMPKMEVIRQVRLNAHLRPMMSTRRPKPRAPMARPAFAQDQMRPVLLFGTLISWLPVNIRCVQADVHSQDRGSNQTHALGPGEVEEVAAVSLGIRRGTTSDSPKPAQEPDAPLVPSHAHLVDLAGSQPKLVRHRTVALPTMTHLLMSAAFFSNTVKCLITSPFRIAEAVNSPCPSASWMTGSRAFASSAERLLSTSTPGEDAVSEA